MIFECDVISWKIFLIWFGLVLCESLNSFQFNSILIDWINQGKFHFEQRIRSTTIFELNLLIRFQNNQLIYFDLVDSVEINFDSSFQ